MSQDIKKGRQTGLSGDGASLRPEGQWWFLPLGWTEGRSACLARDHQDMFPGDRKQKEISSIYKVRHVRPDLGWRLDSVGHLSVCGGELGEGPGETVLKHTHRSRSDGGSLGPECWPAEKFYK